MAIVFIPSQLRELTEGTQQVSLDGQTVGELLNQLEQCYPGVKARLCEGEQLVPGLQVSIDHVMTSHGVAAKVNANSEVHFLPAIGGG